MTDNVSPKIALLTRNNKNHAALKKKAVGTNEKRGFPVRRFRWGCCRSTSSASDGSIVEKRTWGNPDRGTKGVRQKPRTSGAWRETSEKGDRCSLQKGERSRNLQCAGKPTNFREVLGGKRGILRDVLGRQGMIGGSLLGAGRSI